MCHRDLSFRGIRKHVHHVRGIANDPQHTELLILCPSCHDIVSVIHRRSRERYSMKMITDLWRLAQKHGSLSSK